jgi:hypothetical protein
VRLWWRKDIGMRSRLVMGGFFRSATAVAVLVATCCAALAGPPNDRVRIVRQPAQKTQVKWCRISVSGSAFPQPCDRVGAIPSTAIPMDIIGEYPVERIRR